MIWGEGCGRVGLVSLRVASGDEARRIMMRKIKRRGGKTSESGQDKKRSEEKRQSGGEARRHNEKRGTRG